MRSGLLYCSLVSLAVACADTADSLKPKQGLINEMNTDSAEGSKDVTQGNTPTNIQVDSVIHLAFAPDSFSVTVRGHLDKKGDPVICYLPVGQGKRLTAIITPEKPKANIRFSHIYLPDGKSDGPFSPSLKYKLVQRGTYKIYVSPNRMAGDPVSTDFKLYVKVE